MEWALSQLASYSTSVWLLFIFLTLIASYVCGVPGLLLAHMAIALIVFVLDSAWIDSEISKPGWDGQPDRDFVFMIGVLVRIVLINTALLPVGILAMWTRGRAWPWTTIKEHNEELAN